MPSPAPEQTLGVPKVVSDVWRERATHPRLPPGETGFNLLRTHRLQRDSLRVLLDFYARYGPVFTVRAFHRPIVFMLGPEANHFVTVAGAEHFSWRRGMFGRAVDPACRRWIDHDRWRLPRSRPADPDARLPRSPHGFGSDGDGGGSRAGAWGLARGRSHRRLRVDPRGGDEGSARGFTLTTGKDTRRLNCSSARCRSTTPRPG